MAYVNAGMKSGDLIFDRGITFFARLIEWWTGAPFSHCGVIIETPAGLIVSHCISPTGVNVLTIEQFFDRFTVDRSSWISTGAKVAWTDDVLARTMALVGQPYSTLSEYEVAIGLTPPDGEYICSLYAAKVLSFCGINIPRKGLTPRQLAKFFTDQGKKISRC